MPEYVAPLKDIDFALNHVAGLAEVAKLDGFQHADPDTVSGLLTEAARFFSEVMSPLNRAGDVVGSRLQEDGSVKTPDGFPTAYRKYVEAGWAGGHLPEEWGGGGLPYTVGIVLQEMFKSANMAFALAPMLTQAAIEALLQHGSEEQRATYLEKLVSGEWSGTMCLTEPHAGSDVGALTSRAVRRGDGSYRITGQKIFITWGDHDLTENVIHLVLARTPDAAPGTKGISMFIVPKYLLDANGHPGDHNDVRVVSLEHKLGIHASPTCVVAFGDGGEGAVGYLVGEEQQGMKYMFTMMNSARIGVGLEGLAMGERAYQASVAYAGERRQGRAVGAEPTESSPIIDHPDVRRMLMTMRAYNEAMRCLLYTAAAGVDHEHHADSEEARRRAGERVALLTPITKAWCTDLGVELTSLGIQVHGGMGYVEETGVAQHYRDARIAPIYEGTNGIQAIDLVLRKLPLRNGAVLTEFLSEIGETVAAMEGIGELDAFRTHLREGVSALSDASGWLGSRIAAGEYDDALAGATPYLRLFGNVTGGWLMARSALAALGLLESGSGDAAWLRAKVATCRFYGEQLLPSAFGLVPSITAGAAPLFGIEPELLGP
jgi:3-(methylthio)propanoyl-CoA dehydrogenase